MARPREYDDDLRVRLVESAARILAAEGPHAVTLRRVATDVGTSTTAIYSLIGSKDDLARGMFREGFQRLADHLEAVERTDDPLADLRDLGEAYHHMAMESPQLYLMMFSSPIPEFRVNQDDSEFALSTLAMLIECVQRCIDGGHLAGDAGDLAMQIWGLNHGITSLAINQQLGPPEEARRKLGHAGRALIEGFRAIDEPTTAGRDPVSSSRET